MVKEITGLFLIKEGQGNSGRMWKSYDEAALEAKRVSLGNEGKKVYVMVKAASGKGVEYYIGMSAAGRVEEYWLNGKQGF